MYISLWENSRGHPDNISFMQFSTKIDGFEQKDSQGFKNSYNSYEQYPLEKFFIFTIYQNYTLALTSSTYFTCIKGCSDDNGPSLIILSSCSPTRLDHNISVPSDSLSLLDIRTQTNSFICLWLSWRNLICTCTCSVQCISHNSILQTLGICMLPDLAKGSKWQKWQYLVKEQNVSVVSTDVIGIL